MIAACEDYLRCGLTGEVSRSCKSRLVTNHLCYGTYFVQLEYTSRITF